MVHVMLDIETLGTAPHSALMEIGAVAFELKSGGRVYNGNRAFKRNIIVEQSGGTIDHSTLCFWFEEMTNGSKMAYKMKTNAVPLPQALNELLIWPGTIDVQGLKSWEDVEGVWAKGPSFDLSNLTDKYRRFGSADPWHYRKHRCVRTFLEALGVDPKELGIDAKEFEPHDSVDDCIWQITEMQKALAIRGSRLS